MTCSLVNCKSSYYSVINGATGRANGYNAEHQKVGEKHTARNKAEIIQARDPIALPLV